MIELDELLDALEQFLNAEAGGRSIARYKLKATYRTYKAAKPPLVLEAVDEPNGTIEHGYIYYDGQCYRLPEVEND